MTSAARKKTLARMKSVVAFSAGALAMYCTDACDSYDTLDGLAFPTATLDCSGFNATFKVTVREFSPRDAGVTDARADAAADAGDAGDPDAADAGDAAPLVDASSPPAAPYARPRILVTIELRPGTTGMSLQSGAVVMDNESGTSKIAEIRPSSQLVDVEIDVDPTESFFNVRLEQVGDCNGTSISAVLIFNLEHGRVTELEGDLGGNPEPVTFAP